jgi:heme-degrading monooxygenase HmoA
MIRVIIERRLKRGEDIAPLLRQLRAAAMLHRGYITGETLVSTEDKSTITVISTWRSLEDWQSKGRGFESSQLQFVAKVYRKLNIC